MVRVLMIIMGCCALLGGMDRIAGNRLGLGKAFEDGFQMLGSLGLSMGGIICLAPVLAQTLGRVIAPVYHALGQDPGMFGSILAIDMGGYQMAVSLADAPAVGRFSGILAAAVLGCTVSFTIPTGMGMFTGDTRRRFAQGMLYGLAAMPVSLVLGALLCGFSLLQALWICLPVVVLSALLMLALVKAPGKTLRGFEVFAAALRIVTTAGLALAAFQYITGWTILPGLAPLEESMAVVSSIGIMMLGSLPMAELLQRFIRRPLNGLGQKLGIGSETVAGMILTFISVMAGLAVLPRADRKGQTMSAAFMVSGASCLGAHFAFAMNCAPQLGLPLILTKLAGGLLAAAAAGCFYRREDL